MTLAPSSDSGCLSRSPACFNPARGPMKRSSGSQFILRREFFSAFGILTLPRCSAAALEPQPLVAARLLRQPCNTSSSSVTASPTVDTFPSASTTTRPTQGALVVDENFGTTVTARQEGASEYGPWGGIPGIFAQLAVEAGLPYDVHIEAISATTLAANYKAAQSVIAQPLWNSMVLQEASFEPITKALSYNSKSNPSAFCGSGAHLVILPGRCVEA